MMNKEAIQSFAMRAVMSVVAAIETVESGIAFNPLDSKNLDNPYPHYHRLREKTRCIGAAWDRGYLAVCGRA